MSCLPWTFVNMCGTKKQFLAIFHILLAGCRIPAKQTGGVYTGMQQISIIGQEYCSFKTPLLNELANPISSEELINFLGGKKKVPEQHTREAHGFTSICPLLYHFSFTGTCQLFH